MHQGGTDTGSLPVRANTQRSQSERRLVIDIRTRSDDMTNHDPALDRNQRQLGDPPDIIAQPCDEHRFTGISAWLHRRCTVFDAAECGCRD